MLEVISWPFPPPSEPPSKELSDPTWICPGGTCLCHPGGPEDVDLVPHTIVFHDPNGVRMPLARCMVYENGRALTAPTTAANAVGELEIELKPTTKRLTVAWCAAVDLLERDEPYHKIYHVDLEQEPTRRRLANIGFASRPRFEDNIRDYQRAFAQPATGQEQDIAEDLRRRHDEGALTPFAPRPDVEPVAATTNDQAFARTLRDPRSFDKSPFKLRDDGAGSEVNAKQAAPGKPGQQGAVVPNVGSVWVLVGLEPEGPLKPDDVTVELLLAAADRSTKPTLIRPTVVVPWDAIPNRYVVCAFANVPQGSYIALAHAKNVKDVSRHYALGRVDLVITTGLLTLAYVPLTRDHAILTANDPLLELEVDVMQRRRKVLAMLHVFFPQSADTATAPADMPPYQQGTYKKMLPGLDATNTCAPINVSAMTKAGATGTRFGFNQVLVDAVTFHQTVPAAFTEQLAGSAPSVGDSFLATDDAGFFHHCGIVVKSATTTPSLWLTADGGQPDRTTPFMEKSGNWRRFYSPPPSREAAYIVPRRVSSVPGGKIAIQNRFIFPGNPPPSGGELIRGWTDVTHPTIPFAADYTADITDADFRAFVKRVIEVETFVQDDINKAALQQSPL